MPSFNKLVQIGETMGIEFETELIPGFYNPTSVFKPMHDASIETDARILNCGLILLKNIKDERLRMLIGSRSQVIGTEYVSEIIHYETAFNETRKLISILMELGEGIGIRSGIHYHFSLPNPGLKILKNILLLGSHLESVFFNLAGLGSEYRGLENDSVYCRPITKFGPQVISTYKRESAQCFSIEDALKAKTLDDFWGIYGDCTSGRNTRYNPVRYVWLNIYNMFPGNQDYKGTLEFRVFNKTFNPKFIDATIMFCKYFLDYILKQSFSPDNESIMYGLPNNSVYFNNTVGDNIEILINFAEKIKMDNKTLESLIDILKLTPNPKLDHEYIYTHLVRNNSDYWGRNNGYYPEKIIEDSDMIKTPDYVDIHLLRGDRR